MPKSDKPTILEKLQATVSLQGKRIRVSAISDDYSEVVLTTTRDAFTSLLDLDLLDKAGRSAFTISDSQGERSKVYRLQVGTIKGVDGYRGEEERDIVVEHRIPRAADRPCAKCGERHYDDELHYFWNEADAEYLGVQRYSDRFCESCWAPLNARLESHKAAIKASEDESAVAAS